MDTEKKKRSKTRKRRRLPAPRRQFQASFLNTSSANKSLSTPCEDRSTSPLPSKPDPLIYETLVRLRYRSPVQPVDYRTKFARVPEELQLNSLLVRQSLRNASSSANSRKPLSHEAVFKTLDSGGDSDTTEQLPRLPPAPTPQFLLSGMSANITAKSRHESPAPLRPVSGTAQQPQICYDSGKKAHLMEMRRSDNFSLKYFNAEVIPKKPQRTVTLSDIQKYLKYIGTKPFR